MILGAFTLTKFKNQQNQNQHDSLERPWVCLVPDRCSSVPLGDFSYVVEFERRRLHKIKTKLLQNAIKFKLGRMLLGIGLKLIAGQKMKEKNFTEQQGKKMKNFSSSTKEST